MDDQTIVRQCLEGDPKSFRRVVADHEAPLMAAAVTILGNRQDAEDLCQETFIQAYRHLESFDGARNLRAWLYTILYRRGLNVLKRKRKLAVIVDRLKVEPSSWMPPNETVRAVESLLLAEAFEVLSAKERAVLSLWVNEGYTAAEIAAILGCPAGTVRYHLFNARRKIRSFSEKSHANLPRR